MNKILGQVFPLRILLGGGAKYGVDFYQREYRWEKKQVDELLNDLESRFLNDYTDGDSRHAVGDYNDYFLGSIITSEKGGDDNGQTLKLIVDGQQRLTTLTLLFIYLHRTVVDKEDKAEIMPFVYARRRGERSFNISVDERDACMEGLLTNGQFDSEGKSDSVINMCKRYEDIEDGFPDGISGDILPHFTDWLMDKVCLAEIKASSDADAYNIFETMNDRGLSLTSAEKLRGYLLAKTLPPAIRAESARVWRERVDVLREIEQKAGRPNRDVAGDVIKAWLRGQHAMSIRARKRDATPEDFDLIGTVFHRWVIEKQVDLGLEQEGGYARFIQQDFQFYARWYAKIREAEQTRTRGLEPIYYNAQNGFTLQHPVLLAPIVSEDNEGDILRKLRVVSTFLDIIIARRAWNRRKTDYSTMQSRMFQILKGIRGASVDDLINNLTKQLADETDSFPAFPVGESPSAEGMDFGLTGTNRGKVHYLLARIIDHLEKQSDKQPRFDEYMDSDTRKKYQIEHIWANQPGRHSDEFEAEEFNAYRNRIGGLLLIPRKDNGSFGDKPYADKYEHYYGQNVLAQTLHANAYKNNPGFLGFVARSGLPFKPHPDFKKADLDSRQALYLEIAKQIWHPDTLRD